MGMYDYLSGEQVKIFYVPIFQSSGTFSDQSAIWHSGGQLRSFNLGDKLPLKTLYYQYPEHFLIYDYRDSYENVWIVENGRLKNHKTIHQLKDSDLIGPVFDNFGSLLNISSVQHFFTIKFELKKAQEKDQQAELQLFPNGAFHTIRNNHEFFVSKEKEWEKIKYKEMEKFTEYWVVSHPYQNEMNFGEAIESYLFHHSIKDKEQFGPLVPMEDYLSCIKYIKNFIEEHPSIISSYKKWINDENLLEEIEFEKILQEITHHSTNA